MKANKKEQLGSVVSGVRLRRCPFCGGKAELRETTSFEWVECSGCHVEMTRSLDGNDGPDRRWNRRAKPPSTPRSNA
jgi:hypothetical protein